jgi:phage terminase large subunit-like protein
MQVMEQKKCSAKKDVNNYIRGVLSGKITACEYVKLACQRHLTDLEKGSERGLWFDEEAAQKVIDFIALLKHSKGKWAGSNFKLEGWQLFIVWVLFGWMRADGTRRFRTAYIEVARKNGKSTLIAALGLYGLGFDNEAGAEVYSVATKEDQAKITWREGARMTKSSGNLGGLATVTQKVIAIDSLYASWKPLGKDSDTQDGLDPHYILVDEFHAHKDRSLLDVMDSGVGARTQPLIFIITTAGFNNQSACKQERDYAVKVLTGTIEDDDYFAIIFTLDEADDWKDEKCWQKANPNLGITVSIDDMQRLKKKAIESPATLTNFLTKKLNLWTTAKIQWMNMEKWRAAPCYIPGEGIISKAEAMRLLSAADDSELGIKLAAVNAASSLKGAGCWGGIDLSSNKDLSCWGRLFIVEDYYLYLPTLYVPKDSARRRSTEDRVPYELWIRQGFLTATEGDVIDYDFIREDIWRDFGAFDVKATAFDRYNFEAIRQQLIKEGTPEDRLISFGQGFISMSGPMKRLEREVLAGRLIHNYNPVLMWMAENVAAKIDAAENIKPDKENSTERIDGIVALIMALGIATTVAEKKPSVYETGDYFKW